MILAMKEVNNGNLTLGSFVGLNAIIIQLSVPLNFLGTVYREIRQALVDLEAMFEIFSQKIEIKDKNNLSGDIEIKFTGLRDGEKLYEELLIGDNVTKTMHDHIMSANEEKLSHEKILYFIDKFNKLNLKVFGPSQAAAQLESSKIWAKNFMKRNDIPTAQFQIFDNAQKAIEYVKSIDFNVVVKADGLAAGKGVIICHNQSELDNALDMNDAFKVVSVCCIIGLVLEMNSRGLVIPDSVIEF